MEEENWDEFIEQFKDTYQKIGYVRCPAFPDEQIHFNHYGLKHLLFKGRKLRLRGDIRRRIFLLPYAIMILKNNNNIYYYQKSIKNESTAYFWEIRREINIYNKSRIIRIVIRKLNNESFHFFSVYDK
jgi:hypothetical protein